MEVTAARVTSGISGLDEVLRGGFVSGRMYLVCGDPGTGKTLLGMHFLEAGIENDETVLCIHGEESRDEILMNGARVGINLDTVQFLDLGPNSEFFTEDRNYDLVEPGAVERDRYTEEIHDAIRDINPDRVVLDPITQLRYIETNEHQFRKRILSFMRFLKERNTTVIGTATLSKDTEYQTEMRSLSDGVVRLSHTDRGRRLRVAKHRGFGQHDGSHGLAIRNDGVEVFPSLVPEQLDSSWETRHIRSGLDNLDDLLGGGLERGTVTFISGPTGVGKTTTATQFLAEAATQGIDSLAYLFEEGTDTFTHRSESMGIPLSDLREEGTISLNAVEPLAQSAEEFAQRVQREIDETGSEIVLIDGIDGYKMSIQGSDSTLVEKIHALSRHLKNRDVTVLITDEIPQITGMTTATSSNLSYIADNILFLSYIETEGTLEKVIGVLKKRAGGFENALREFDLDDGIHIGEPLTHASGILQGTPQINQGQRDQTDG
ncbi:ATPase domain-containing protein [Salinibaculum rarum]|uniref:ATPase domain-containing protein n=1 Tax=Salinibaculum rarum TaxID=3058903 RepID=UPI00265DEA7C|nr:ATPase domain-containing protein [Salinibaculum sp. KK48]